MAFYKYFKNSLMSYKIDVLYSSHREPTSIILTIDFYYLLDKDSLPPELFMNSTEFLFCIQSDFLSCGFFDQMSSV